MLYFDRHAAGKAVAGKLSQYRERKDVIVIGLARGGVVVAYEVAKELALPLNVIVPRKIGAPYNPELALGSIMENGQGVFNSSIIHALGVSKSYIASEIEKEKAKAQQRLSLYRSYAPLPQIKGSIVILVDDGIATGSTMLTAIQAMRKAEAKVVVVAAPVSSKDAYEAVSREADEVFILQVDENFIGVGMYYQHFDQTDDQEVVTLLQ